ncbi:hypothetical protein MFLO_15945 [Listeria floridensis FSL S10-1187]|uniref:Helix-turn-helix domain-containing protein n=1 Tax=Listeria floridensis FSL S10-1187 TaxID=1265817 RepID=A0ABP3ATD4_9LIST|nr:helix-turn-helix domain-containing protein [Listeria floridensis]EUJ23457.1 hypothetical protein MFLO_15945 [Listeria floridensis FSL S10-1187]
MKQATFTKVPNKAIDDPALNGNDLRVLLAICRYAHNKTRKCHPSRATLCRKARVGNKTLAKSLETLVNWHYINIESRYSNGAKLSNEYTVIVSTDTMS